MSTEETHTEPPRGGWQRLKSFFQKLYRHERIAVLNHLDAAQARWSVARQAADLTTLVTDQLRLAGDTRRRFAFHWQGITAIFEQLLRDAAQTLVRRRTEIRESGDNA